MKWTVLFVCLFLSLYSWGQSKSFPNGWIGNWTGQLQIEKHNNVLTEIPFSLDIQKTENQCYTWTIEYKTENSPPRPYLLCPADSIGQHWEIDEQNGIILDAYLHDNTLHSVFEVMGSLLICKDELRGDTLYHEILGSSKTQAIVTGDTILQKPKPEGGINQDTIPAVTSYVLPNRQWAKLTRKK